MNVLGLNDGASHGAAAEGSPASAGVGGNLTAHGDRIADPEPQQVGGVSPIDRDLDKSAGILVPEGRIRRDVGERRRPGDGPVGGVGDGGV